MNNTEIQWTDRTWNPIDGCSHRSPGCKNCYAEKMASRFSGPGLPYEGLVKDGRWTGEVRFHKDRLLLPPRWRRPSRVFVNSMGDLFHPNVKFEWVAAIFGVMAGAPDHTFQILTKWPQRALEFFGWVKWRVHENGLDDVAGDFGAVIFCHARGEDYQDYAKSLSAKARERLGLALAGAHWPLENVWIGTSVETQKEADTRVPVLFDIPATVRFVSAEPLLGPIRFAEIPGLNRAGSAGHDRLKNFWVIVGGESGGNEARVCDVAWIRRIVNDCRIAHVPVFVKQLGSRIQWRFGQIANDGAAGSASGTRLCNGLLDSKGGDITEWPEDLRVREFPRIATDVRVSSDRP